MSIENIFPIQQMFQRKQIDDYKQKCLKNCWWQLLSFEVGDIKSDWLVQKDFEKDVITIFHIRNFVIHESQR